MSGSVAKSTAIGLRAAKAGQELFMCSPGTLSLRFVPRLSSYSVDMSASFQGVLLREKSLCSWKEVWPQRKDTCAYC